MTEVTFQILKMRPATELAHTGSEVIAIFDVDVFPFRIRRCNVRRRPSGELWVTLPGRNIGGISISSPELRTAIREEALIMYQESHHAWT